MQLRWGDRITSAGIRAVNDEYGVIRGMFMGEGRFLTPDDLASMRRVAVLGYDLKQKLFSRSPALDQDVFINGIRFTVIGILKKKIAISNYFDQDDNCAMIPINVMGIMLDIRYNTVLVFQPVSGVLEDGAVRQVRPSCRRRTSSISWMKRRSSLIASARASTSSPASAQPPKDCWT